MALNRTKRKRAKAIEFSDYIVQIMDWSPSYSMRLDLKARFSPGPYWEHQSLRITGIVLEPENLKDRKIKLVFLADRTLPSMIEGSDNNNYTPKGVGYLNLRGQSSEFTASVPIDFYQILPFFIHIGKFKFISLFGPKLHRGESLISSFFFDQEYNPEEEE